MNTAITILDQLLSRHRAGDCIEYADLLKVKEAMEQTGVEPVEIRYRHHYPTGPADGTRRIGDWKRIPYGEKELGDYPQVLAEADQVEYLYTAPQPAQQAVQRVTGGLDDDTRIGWASWRIKDLEQQLASCQACLAQPAQQAEPVAWLHEVTTADECDLALSFSKDNFPLEGVAGWRSERQTPLYTAPQPAQQPEADKLLRQALEAFENCVGDSLLGGTQRAAVMTSIRKHLGEA